MEIKYYLKSCGTGNCSTCAGIKGKVAEAAKELGIEATVTVFKGMEAAAAAGVPELPAMVIKNELIASGYEPSQKEVLKALKKFM